MIRRRRLALLAVPGAVVLAASCTASPAGGSGATPQRTAGPAAVAPPFVAGKGVRLGDTEFLAPAAADADPRLTPRQAWHRYAATVPETSARGSRPPPGTVVRLGVYFDGGVLGFLSYGFRIPGCLVTATALAGPASRCVEWAIVDAKTGIGRGAFTYR